MPNFMVNPSVTGQILDPHPARLLITTFDTWLPHHRSNAADDLIQQAIDRQDLPPDTLLLRHLPVDNTAASALVCDYIDRVHPRVILCCGMAESRSRLSLERQATLNGQTRPTLIPLKDWCDRLAVTDLSDDAGQFVCNHLYYQVLDHPRAASQVVTEVKSTDPHQTEPASCEALSQRHQAVFLHVPCLTAANRLDLAQDLAAIVQACMTL